MSKCSAVCSTPDCRRLTPRPLLPPPPLAPTHVHSGSRSAVDTAVGEDSCIVHVHQRLQHSRLPSTDTTTATTSTDTDMRT